MEIILYDDVLPKLVCFSLSNFVKFKIMYFVFTPSKKLKLSDHMCVCRPTTHRIVMKWFNNLIINLG